MNDKTQIKIIGSQVACRDGLKDSWREVAKWAAERLRMIYGDQVKVHYFDLFDADCPPIPANSLLPVVLVNEVLVSSGGKISPRLISEKIEELEQKGTSQTGQVESG